MRPAPEFTIDRPLAPALAPAGKARASALRPAFVLLSAIAVTLFVILYVRAEQPIYFWDWVHHFNMYRSFGALVRAGGVDWLPVLANSIQVDDYNLAALAPMAPAYLVFGDSRAAYIAAIVLLYLLPACYLAARLAARSGVSLPLAWLAALLFWPFWIAALRGMPDVAGLIPLGNATLIIFETRFLTRASIADGLKLGLAVWAAFLLRRWYAYACVSVEFTTLAFATWTIVSAKSHRYEATRRALTAFAVNGLAGAACLMAFQLPLVVRILGTKYADAFDAYQKPFTETAQAFFDQTGLILLAAITVGIVRAARTRNLEIAFMAVAGVMTSVLFLQTQAPGVQHVLPVVFWLFPVALYGALWPLAATYGLRTLGGPALVLALLAGWMTVFVPPAHRLLVAAGPLLPTQAYPPLALQARATYDAMVSDLERMLTPVDKVAVFASNFALSGSLLATLAPSLPLEGVSNVDKRDGLHLAPFAARFAIATKLPALHLPAQSQRVVQIPDQMIANGTGPGAAYRRVAGPYLLDDGTEASIYRRERPWTPDDAAAMLTAMQAYYPTWTIKDDIAH